MCIGRWKGNQKAKKGIIEVEAEIDDETHMIPFEDLPVECPIISVKKVVKKKERGDFQRWRRIHPQHYH